MTTSRFVLILLLLAGAAGGAFLALGGEGGDELPPQGVIETPRTGPSDGTSIQVENGIDPRGGRQGVRDIIDDQAATNTGFAQGVMGTVYGPSGSPVHGASVFLVESSTSNMFERFLAVQQGVVFLPTASGQTDEQGRFALGLRESVPGVVFEVKIISATFADHKIPNLSIQENDWYEAPAVVLSAGTMVHGQVSLAGQGLPVPGAVVYIKAAGGFSDIVPIPGREQGLRVEVDANGYFQTRNAPAGIVDISAVAPYFARMEQRGVNLEPMVANEVNFELSRGLTIRGIVTSIYITPTRPTSAEEARRLLQEAYSDEPFVRVLPAGEAPSLRSVRGSNFCDVAAFADERTNTLILLSSLDNLVKGASGGAVQCANRMCGHPEELGLLEAPLLP